MYEIIVKEHFSAAHQLRDISGICENLHGHNWRVDISVSSEILNDIGIVVDFKVVEDASKKIIDCLDHQILNELAIFQDLNPSAENIARYICEELKRKLDRDSFRVRKVTVWETDTYGASYSC